LLTYAKAGNLLFNTMNKEIQSIIHNLQNVLEGQCWYGRAVYQILNEIDPATVYHKPTEKSHSMIELLYHMNTWAAFCLKSMENAGKEEMTVIEENDWRIIDPAHHSWEKGLAEFKSLHEKIISLLQTKEDDWLNEKVKFREYNFRFMLNGLIQHNIYHLGQIAYLNKQR
jgi:uncharacterized damage-inducible protein DinB